jgi:hypothetical protein
VNRSRGISIISTTESSVLRMREGVYVQCDARDCILYGDFNGFFNPLPSVLNKDPSAGEGSHLNKANMTSKVAFIISYIQNQEVSVGDVHGKTIDYLRIL